MSTVKRYACTKAITPPQTSQLQGVANDENQQADARKAGDEMWPRRFSGSSSFILSCYCSVFVSLKILVSPKVWYSICFFYFRAYFRHDQSMDLFFHQGLRSPFTEAPSDPTYVAAGSNARLKWNFIIQGSFRRVEIEYETSGSWTTLVSKDQGGSVATNPNLPNSLTSRITIEGNATLVISAVNTGDSTRYRCAFVPLSGSTAYEDLVQLIVTGEIYVCELPPPPPLPHPRGFIFATNSITSFKKKAPPGGKKCKESECHWYSTYRYYQDQV